MNTNIINIKYTYLTIFISLASIIAAILLRAAVYWGLFAGFIVAVIVSFINGYSLKEVYSMTVTGVKRALLVLIMLSLIGMLISIWMASGTIPSMIFYGFKYLSGTNIILAAFITCSVISMVLGTALGTISTVGSVFLSLAIGLGFPLAPLVGAVVSGSYLGDRTSPMSSSANLTAVITETNIIDNIKHMMSTTIPVFSVTGLVYMIIGNKFVSKAGNLYEIEYIQNLLSSNFNISFISLIPPLLILLTSVILRLPIVKSIAIGLSASVLIFLIRDGALLKDTLYIAINGYYPIDKYIAKIMAGGGLISMKNVLLVIIFSTALNGILEGTRMIAPLIERFSSSITNFKNLIHKTSILCIAISVITCNQTLSSIIPGQYLKKTYENFSISRNTLARTISDTGIIIVPLIPWNVNAILVSSIMGISALKYIPFAFLCYLLPMLTFIYPSFKGTQVKSKQGLE
jgi:NhaC family Na+:H+ antiporter